MSKKEQRKKNCAVFCKKRNLRRFGFMAKNSKQKELRVKEEIINLFVKHSNREKSSIFHSITCTLELEKWREMLFSSISYVKSPMWTWKASTRAINETCLYNDVIECEARRVCKHLQISCVHALKERNHYEKLSVFLLIVSCHHSDEKKGSNSLLLSFKWVVYGGITEKIPHPQPACFSAVICKNSVHTRIPLKKDFHERKKEAIEITKRKDYSDTLFCLNNFARWGVKREFPFKQFLHSE